MSDTSATEPAALNPADIERAAEILGRGPFAVLTGAGISTDSGIPDYRGENSPRREPMTFDEFLSSEARRKRYWAGSALGWKMFDRAEPNTGHRVLAEWQRSGLLTGIITQNVDGLHQKAGASSVVELHGTLARVHCLSCGTDYPRAVIARQIRELNPWLEAPEEVALNPDGDAEVSDPDRVVVPACLVCGGIIKPDVVFFGEYVPNDSYALARTTIDAAGALLVVGSSLVVNSGIRLINEAVRRSVPIVIINHGATKGDRRATLRIEAGASEALTAIAEKLNAIPQAEI